MFFFLAEYASIVLICILTSILFIGGYLLNYGAFIYLIQYFDFDSYIYIKNRAVIPFFKPVVLGPISVSVDSDNVAKAEFYIDGALKDTLTDAPFYWKWDEKAFMKHTLETKIYDEDGNSASSGEKTFFIFHNPLKFK